MASSAQVHEQNLPSVHCLADTIFDSDVLHPVFDLAAFDDVHFEFKQIVPVSGSDPRPIGFTSGWASSIRLLSCQSRNGPCWQCLAQRLALFPFVHDGRLLDQEIAHAIARGSAKHM